jgi:hypothetical protein
VNVEVRHQISEQLVVHVARREHLLDHPSDSVNVAPVRRDFRGAQAREVRNVTISKDDDRMATSSGRPNPTAKFVSLLCLPRSDPRQCRTACTV